MDSFEKRFKIDCSPVASKKQTLVYKNTRFTVIAPCLLRVENQAEGKFCDEPTQSVWFRDFCDPSFEVKESKGKVEIKTEKVTFVYSLGSKKMAYIILADGRKVTNYKAGNLKGTSRTLDVTAIDRVGDGVCSRNGVAVLDDSTTLVIKPDGLILPRDNSETDEYYFAYGMIISVQQPTFISLRARYRLFRDMHFPTGGADIRTTHRANIFH